MEIVMKGPFLLVCLYLDEPDYHVLRLAVASLLQLTTSIFNISNPLLKEEMNEEMNEPVIRLSRCSRYP